MSEYKIELLHDRYLIEAEQLIKDYPEIFAQHDIELYRKDLLEFLLEKPSQHKNTAIYVLVEEEQVRGVFAYTHEPLSRDYYKITWLIIKTGYQGKGYGTLLLKECCKKIKESGGKHAFLETTKEKYNEQAMHFYKKQGFSEMDYLPDYYYSPKAKRQHRNDSVIYYRSI